MLYSETNEISELDGGLKWIEGSILIVLCGQQNLFDILILTFCSQTLPENLKIYFESNPEELNEKACNRIPFKSCNVEWLQ